MRPVSATMYRGPGPDLPKVVQTRPTRRLKGIAFVVCLTRGRILRFDVWPGVTSSSTPHYQKAYHIPKAVVRTSTKGIFSSSCMMVEVCFDRTVGMLQNDGCFMGMLLNDRCFIA